MNARHIFKTLLLGLTFLLSSVVSVSTSYACSVHNHGCVYHAFGSTVNTTPQNNTTGTSLVIYAIGTNSNQPSTVDFDNKVLVPALTGDRVISNTYTSPTGPYIVNSTTYGASHPPPDWNPGGNDGARQVYPSQYQVVFNKNTATAKHTGDLNGGENGNIPNATGCPNLPGKANCEAVVVTGNVPNGVYEQRVRIFNFQNIPNPQVDIQLGAYATGTGTLISSSHIPAKNGGKELADFISLSGTGAISETYKYEFYDRGFDIDRTGVAWFDRSKSRIRKSTPYIAGEHIAQDIYRNTTVTTTTVQGDGSADFFTRTFHKHVGQEVVGYLPPPPSIQDNARIDLGGCPPPMLCPVAFTNTNLLSSEFKNQISLQNNSSTGLLSNKTGAGSLNSNYSSEYIRFLNDADMREQNKINAIHAIDPSANVSSSSILTIDDSTRSKILQAGLAKDKVIITQKELNNFARYQQGGVENFSVTEVLDACEKTGTCLPSMLGMFLNNAQYYVSTTRIGIKSNYKSLTRPLGIPEDWAPSAGKKDGHIKYINPANIHDYVRVKRDGTITQVRDGKAFDQDGNRVNLDSTEAHGISLDEFIFRE